jgi:hypothetical protein
MRAGHDERRWIRVSGADDAIPDARDRPPDAP